MKKRDEWLVALLLALLVLAVAACENQKGAPQFSFSFDGPKVSEAPRQVQTPIPCEPGPGIFVFVDCIPPPASPCGAGPGTPFPCATPTPTPNPCGPGPGVPGCS